MTSTPNPTPDAEREALLQEFEAAVRFNAQLHFTYDGSAAKLRPLEASDERVTRVRKALTTRATHAETALAAALAREAGLVDENAALQDALKRHPIMWRDFCRARAALAPTSVPQPAAEGER